MNQNMVSSLFGVIGVRINNETLNKDMWQVIAVHFEN